jgi:ParB family transcriptional regulator, chromosome partitioning protein
MTEPARRGGLGRGLGALLPTGPRPAETRTTDDPSEPDSIGAYFREVDIDAVGPNPRQPRTVFDDDTLDELVTSIREVGLLQPIVVRDAGEGRFELVMGERRWRAARMAGLTAVPAIVRETGDDQMLRDALLENLHREALNPLEEAAAYGQLLADFECTHEQLATRVGKSRSHVSNTLRLLGLPPAVQRRVAAGVLSAGHARALLGLDDPEAIERLAARIVAEGLSVRAVEELVAVGEVGDRGKARRRGAPADVPGLSELASTLSDRWETRVSIDVGRRRGKLVIEFAGVADLERILGSMAPDVGISGHTDQSN